MSDAQDDGEHEEGGGELESMRDGVCGSGFFCGSDFDREGDFFKCPQKSELDGFGVNEDTRVPKSRSQVEV